MKKFFAVLLFAICFFSAQAAENPFFPNGERHSVAFGYGQGIDTGQIVPPPPGLSISPVVPFSLVRFAYGIPTTAFYLPARVSVNLAGVIGYGTTSVWDWEYPNGAPFPPDAEWKWNEYSVPMIYFSEDAALYNGRRFYAGIGMGIGMQMQQNERIGSKLLFTMRYFAGFRIADSWNMEIHATHFSNGNTADANFSYAFYGLALSHSF